MKNQKPARQTKSANRRWLEIVVRRTGAARVSSMESEKLYLQNLHGELGNQWRSIGDRMAALDRQIKVEKASVPN